MAVECTINVGFHSNFGSFRQSGHSKTPLRLAIINEFRSTQPTTIRSFDRLLDLCMKLILLDTPFMLAYRIANISGILQRILENHNIRSRGVSF